MAKKAKKTKRKPRQAEPGEPRGEGITDGDAGQGTRGYFAAEAEPEPQPADVTEPGIWPATLRKARGAAKLSVLWRVVFGLILIYVFSMVIGLIAFYTDSEVLLFISEYILFVYHVVIISVVYGVGAANSAFGVLVELFGVMSSTFWRVVLVFIPVIAGACCGVYTIAKDKGRAWSEVSALLTSAGFALLIWQIPRIYDMSGTPQGFLTLGLAASLPLVYIFRGSVLAALYCAFHLRFIHYAAFEGAGWVGGGFLHFLGIAPYIAYYLFFHKPADSRTVETRYISLMPLAYLLAYFGSAASLQINLFAAAGLLYTAGLYCDETDTGNWIKPLEDNGRSPLRWLLTIPASLLLIILMLLIWADLMPGVLILDLWRLIILAPWMWIAGVTRGRNPWLGCGWLAVAGLLAAVIAEPGILQSENSFPRDAVSAGYSQFGLFLIFFAAQLFITLRRPTPLKIIIGFVTIAMPLCYMFRLKPENAVWAAGAALLLAGAAALAEELKRKNRVKANIGMFQMMTMSIAVVLADRAEAAGILNFAILIATLLALIAVNRYLRRNSRGKEPCMPAEGRDAAIRKNEKLMSVMKNKKLVLPLFLLAAAAGVWYPLSQIVELGFPPRQYAVFRFGAEIDEPDDPFRGRGARLRIEDQTLSVDKYYPLYRRDKYVYAALEGEENGLAKVVDIAEEPEPGKQVIRTFRAWPDNSFAEKYEGRPTAFHYKVEFQPKRFAMKEKPRPEAERAFSEALRSGGKYVVTVRVYDDGNYLITDLEIDGTPIRKFLERAEAEAGAATGQKK